MQINRSTSKPINKIYEIGLYAAQIVIHSDILPNFAGEIQNHRMRYFLHIGYDGSRYRGWQWQVGTKSVQGTIQTILQRMFKSEVTVYGCGRTDAGVHASQYFIHITVDAAVDYDFKFRLNRNLPDDIAVFDIWEMSDEQHARHDTLSRTYEYFIHSYKDPVIDRYSSYYDMDGIDYIAMQNAAAILPRYNDFTSMCKHPHLHNHTRCEVTHAQLYVNLEQQRMRFSITADRFLRCMIRLCVHFLLKVGTREVSLDEFEHILANKIILPDMRPAKPNGLFLDRVTYPYLDVPSRPGVCNFMKMGLEN